MLFREAVSPQRKRYLLLMVNSEGVDRYLRDLPSTITVNGEKYAWPVFRSSRRFTHGPYGLADSQSAVVAWDFLLSSHLKLFSQRDSFPIDVSCHHCFNSQILVTYKPSVINRRE